MKKNDPDEMNEQRAAWAASVLSSFQSLTRCDPGEECLRDLLTNLHHWADQSGVRWDAAVALATSSYLAEVDGAPVTGLN